MKLFLPLFALCFIFGIILGSIYFLPPLLLLLMLLGGIVLAISLTHSKAYGWLFSVLISAAIAGALLIQLSLRKPQPSCHVTHYIGPHQVRIFAVVADGPIFFPWGQRQLITAQSLLGPDSSLSLCGNIELHRPREAFPLWPGEHIVLQTRLKSIHRNRNPGVMKGGWLHYQSNNVGAIAYVEDQSVMVLHGGKPSFLLQLRERIRQALRQSIPQEASRTIVASLALGEEQEIDPQLREQYARAGLSHLLAVSGLNLTLVSMGVLHLICWILVRIPAVSLRTDPRRIGAPAAAVLAVLYTLLTGAAPSAVRACVMSSICYWGICFYRPPDMVRPLAFAALTLLVWDPINLFRPGFQLSFAAIIGLMLISIRQPLSLFLPEKWARIKCLRWIVYLLLSTFAASLLTFPLVAHHFQIVSTIGLLTNLVAVPLTSYLLLPLSLLGSVLGAIHVKLGLPLLMIAGWMAGYLNAFCQWCSHWSWAVIPFSPGWGATLILCLGSVGCLLSGRIRILLLIISLAALGIITGNNFLRIKTSSLEITFLDVGQGDSIFIQTPQNHHILVDGGGNLVGDINPATYTVIPFLEAMGVKRLDVVVASHSHPDHVQGLETIIENFNIGELWICQHEKEDAGFKMLLKRARQRGILITSPRPLIIDEVDIRPLWPQGYAGFCADPADSANDNSVVLRLAYGQSTVLLTGDIEASVERRMVEAHGPLVLSNLLKVPHHGSATSSTWDLLRATRPQVAVISCGLNNAFNLPDQGVLNRYAVMGIQVLRVDQLGAIRFQMEQHGNMSWQTWQNELP